MIAEAIKALAELATKSAAPQKIESGDPRKIIYVVNGEYHELATVSNPRDHKAGSLDDLIAVANRFAELGPGLPVVWYDSDAVVLVLDDMTGDSAEGHRLEKVTLPLVVSDVFARLVALRANPPAAWMEQKPFERLLRVELSGTLEPGVLLNQVRRIVWTNSSKATVAVGRQAESLGREISSKADTDGKDLPEVVRLMAPVYKTAGERERLAINCSVEIEPAECKLQLLPLPDELERVRQVAIASIGERLAAGLTGVPAYYGRP